MNYYLVVCLCVVCLRVYGADDVDKRIQPSGCSVAMSMCVPAAGDTDDGEEQPIARSAPVGIPSGFTMRIRSRGSSSSFGRPEGMYYNPTTGQSMTESELRQAHDESRWQKLERRVDALERDNAALKFRNALLENRQGRQGGIVGALQDCVFVFKKELAERQEDRRHYEEELQKQLNEYLAKRAAEVDARIAQVEARQDELEASLSKQLTADLEALDERIHTVTYNLAALIAAHTATRSDLDAARGKLARQAAIAELFDEYRRRQDLAEAAGDALS